MRPILLGSRSKYPGGRETGPRQGGQTEAVPLPRHSGPSQRTGSVWSPPKPALEPEKSAVLRDQLLGELAGLASQEEATAWAQGALGAKNTLTTADSVLVEAAFAARLAGFGDGGFVEEPLPSPPGVGNDDAAVAGGAEALGADQPAARRYPAPVRGHPRAVGRERTFQPAGVPQEETRPTHGLCGAGPHRGRRRIARCKPRSRGSREQCRRLAYRQKRPHPERTAPLPRSCAPRSSYPRSRAFCADAGPRTPITCGSPNRARWAAGSATSSRFRSAAPTIASFIAGATKRHGGTNSSSIRSWLPDSCGSIRA